MTSVVADTHALIWYVCDPDKLSTTALNALDRASNTGNLIYISAISLVEIVYLVEKNRLPKEVLKRIVNALDNPNIGIALAALDRNISEKIQQIDRATVPDMPDRIIAATALSLDIPLVSCDSKIQNLTSVLIIW
ncbi:MAG: type II toxin-antitoxin system VapC family toxin [Xenococcaceae cyanobacterium MO_234.B1]|nr:type II toxin-antitoxin system VapC family toxin [Xenococcaceae cyanobacterium MO_234.B1]